ncbi:hypothetical protein KOR42_06100 [Thalassoglobus neptunius]|uniref:Uncharacterized protein n=1 Tax=Thalassoglobus neptunius TaxID=1938619 RepID=A0A5C5X5F8_9PLAN|nr:hypothetical protein [Thalassoglobus neptunius]TWT57252.1 hypothetical protein KOR42_06100 [Thalassoglobus neptunius]
MGKTVTVTINVDFDGLLEDIEEAVEAGIEAGVEHGRRELLQRIPGNRQRTRRHVIAESDATEGVFGVRFPPGRRYETQGTETKRIIDQAWSSIAANTQDVIEQTIQQEMPR